MAESKDELRQELLTVTRKLTERLRWLERGGQDGVPPAPPRRARPARPQAGAVHVPVALPTSTAVSAPSTGGVQRLRLVREELGDCTRCKLSQGRDKLVFGTGSPDAPLMFVGEGPGAEEDHSGEPFVGAAGQLLTRMIEAMGWSRSDVYISNIVKCRPPGNREPAPDEVAACEPFLKKQVAAVRPKLIVSLGSFATHTLLGIEVPISKLRGAWKSYQGIPLMPTFHPAYLLRIPAAKREVWADLKLVMAELDRSGITRPRG